MNHVYKILLVCLMCIGCISTKHNNKTNQTYIIHPDGVSVTLETGTLNLKVCSDKIIRVLFEPQGVQKTDSSLIVIGEWEIPKFETNVKHDTIEILTDHILARVNLRTGAVSFFNDKQELLFAEHPEIPRLFTPAQVLDEMTHHAMWNIRFSDMEGLYGLGQFPEGIMNYRGHRIVMTQENMTVSVPFLLSDRRYGLLPDHYCKLIFNDSPDSSYFWFEVADVLDYYFMTGDDMDDVIRAYREITGSAPLFGKWAYGYWQSKERYKTQEELLGIAREFRNRQIPVDNIMQDWLFWGEDPSLWNAMTFDTARYPDPDLMIQELHDSLNVHLMISIWPVIGYDTELYRDMYPAGLLFEPFHWTDGHTYDAYHPGARNIYWKHVNQKLFSKGIDAYWMDGTEPEIFVAPHERSIKSARRNYLGTMARYLNTYSLMSTGGVYRGQRSANENKRVFILTRSAFPGQQRHAAATWSGDIVAGWETFRNQIPTGLNFCMAGIPYWSNDIGGFHVTRYGAFPGGCDNPGYRELYVRWFQYAAFQPVFRAHGTDTPREIWRFGQPGDWAYDALMLYLDLRYRLMPYIYSMAWKVTEDSYTIMRGLPMDFTNDPEVRSIDDQFMFGPSLMIAPVTDHMYYGEDYYNEAVPAECFITEEGKRGFFNARYYNGRNLDTLMVDSLLSIPVFDVYLGKDLPPQVHWDRNSMSWSGFIQPKISGEYELWLTSDDAVRFVFNGTKLAEHWNDKGADSTYRFSIPLEAEKRYPFRIEQSRQADATKLRLAWRTPDMNSRKYNPESECGTRRLYLPGDTEWYDFWTGEKFAGGEWIDRDVPIHVMPVYVRAGSILPIGPKLQYAMEETSDPVELRIYSGTDAEFILYEDEGDGYDYENGSFSLIPIYWNENDQTLTISTRIGTYPGMSASRTFQVKIIGSDIDASGDNDITILYNGETKILAF